MRQRASHILYSAACIGFVVAHAAALSAQSTTAPTAQSVAASSDVAVMPGGLPLSFWVGALGLTGGSIAIGRGILDLFNSFVTVTKEWASGFSDRQKVGLQREQAETQQVKEEAKSMEQTNEALRIRDEAISKLFDNQANQAAQITALHGQMTEQNKLMLAVQQHSLDQAVEHAKQVKQFGEHVLLMSQQLQVKEENVVAANRRASDSDARVLELERQLKEANVHAEKLEEKLNEAQKEINDLKAQLGTSGVPSH